MKAWTACCVLLLPSDKWPLYIFASVIGFQWISVDRLDHCDKTNLSVTHWLMEINELFNHLINSSSQRAPLRGGQLRFGPRRFKVAGWSFCDTIWFARHWLKYTKSHSKENKLLLAIQTAIWNNPKNVLSHGYFSLNTPSVTFMITIIPGISMTPFNSHPHYAEDIALEPPN